MKTVNILWKNGPVSGLIEVAPGQLQGLKIVEGQGKADCLNA